MRGLVCLHGFTGSPASFDPLASALARRGGVRLFRPALLGHETPRPGAAARPRRVRRFEDEVDRIAALIGRERLAGAHLCGYSLGARVALGLLARHPFLFAGATLIGVHPGLGSLDERRARAGSDERWCALLERRGVAAFLGAWEAQPLFASQRALAPARLAEQRAIRSAHTAEGLAEALRVLGLARMPDYRGALVTCPVPVRLVVGERDEKFSALAAGLERLAPSARRHVVAGVGHNVLLEAGAHVADLVTGALAA